MNTRARNLGLALACLLSAAAFLVSSSPGSRAPARPSAHPETPARPSALVVLDTPLDLAGREGLAPDARCAGLHFDLGESFDYELASRSVVSLEAEQTEPSSARSVTSSPSSPITVESRFTLRFQAAAYDPVAGEYTLVAEPLAAEIDALTVDAGVDSGRVTKPFAVRMDSRGCINAWSFPETPDKRARALVQALVANSLQFLVVAPGSEPIAERLADETGWHRASFERRPPRLLDGGAAEVIARTKLGYEGSERSDRVGASIEILRSEAEADLDAHWIRASMAIENRRARVDFAACLVESSFSASRTRHGREPVDGSALLCFERSWEPAFDPGSGEDDADALDDGLRPEDLEALLQELQALALEERLDSEEAFRAWAKLGRLLALHSELLEPLETRILTGEFGSARDFVVTAIGAAGGAGSTRAAATLAHLLDESVGDQPLRLAVLVAAHELGAQGVPFLPSLQAVLRGEPDPGLRAAAILSLGTLVGSARDQSESLAALEASREWAFSVGHPEVYLGALGNSRVPALMQVAFDYLEDTSVDVRTAACDVLGKVQGREAVEALVGAATHDVDAVQAAAATALGDHAPDPTAAACLTNLATGHANAQVRLQAVLALAGFKSLAIAVQALNQIAQRDPDPELRQLALQVLQ